MSEQTFRRVLDGIRSFEPPPSVFFGGFGEPLAHPRIVSMVARAKAAGAPKVELITNGCLLDEEMAKQLIQAGLDTLWVSLDGIRPESYSDVRLGALLPDVLENLRVFREVRRELCDCSDLPAPRELPGWGIMPDPAEHDVEMEQYLAEMISRFGEAGAGVQPAPSPAGSIPARKAPELGITFVAMKRNIADLPFLLLLGRILGASRFNVSNVIPYTEELLAEILWKDTLRLSPLPALWHTALRLPAIDVTGITREPLEMVIHGRHERSLAGADVSAVTRYCPFVEAGTTAVTWDGAVSPCQALIHSHTEFITADWKRRVDRHLVGNLAERSLRSLWLDPAYLEFRRKVQAFDFAPCLACGGCNLASDNEEDCEGPESPRCGACLWSHGLIRCP